MDSEDEDYEFDVDPVVTSEQDHTIRYGDHRATTSSPSPSSSSEHEDEYDNPTPTPPLLQAMDIPSVRRPPVSVMVPADRVSTRDLPLAESLSALVSREKYHKIGTRYFSIGITGAIVNTAVDFGLIFFYVFEKNDQSSNFN